MSYATKSAELARASTPHTTLQGAKPAAVVGRAVSHLSSKLNLGSRCRFPPAKRYQAAQRFSVQATSNNLPPGVTPEQLEQAKKIYEEAMADPEKAAKMKAMQQAMNSPQMAEQMKQMQAFQQNPQVQQRLKELQEDPELKYFFDDMRTGGPTAIMKYWNDKELMTKLQQKMGDLALQPPEEALENAKKAAEAEQQAEIETLHDAARYGDLEAAEDLLAVGKDPNEQDEGGRTPLHAAIAFDRLPIVEELIKAKADPNVVDNQKNSPLHFACGYGRVEHVKALLAAGADVDLVNEPGQSAHDLATADERNPLNQHPELLEQLEGSPFKDQA